MDYLVAEERGNCGKVNQIILKEQTNCKDRTMSAKINLNSLDRLSNIELKKLVLQIYDRQKELEKENKELKEALKKSEEKFQFLVEQSLQGIIVIQDIPPHIVFVNQRCAEISGYSVQDLLSFSPGEVLKLLLSDEQSYFLDQLKDRFSGKLGASHYEFRIVRKDGTERWVEALAKRIEYYGRPATQAVVIDITERKQAEMALQESEENFRKLAENANDGIVISAGEGKHVFANKRASEITGYTVDELLKIGYQELGHPDEQKKLDQRYKARIAGKKVPNNYETAIVRKDGGAVPLEITASKTTWHGNPADIVIMRDISKRKQMEEMLRDSEQRYRAIVEDQTELICRFVPDGTLTFVNEAYCRYFGKKLGDLLYHKFAPFIIEDDRDIVQKQISTITRVNPVETHEQRVITPSGKIAWQQWTNRGIFDENGNCVGYQAVGRDITQLKEVEAELSRHRDHLEQIVAERTAELQLAEKELRVKENAIASSINAIILTDLEGNLTYVNPSFLKLLGYDNDSEILGKPASSILRSRIRIFKIFKAIRGNGSWSGELNIEKKDESSLSVFLTANMVTDQEDKPICIMASFVDITQLKLLQAQLMRSKLLAISGQLAVSIAHEVNSPLQAISCLLKKLKIGHDENPESLKDIDLLEESYSKIKSTVKNFLNLHSPAKAAKQPTNINIVIQNTISLLNNYLKDNRVNIHMNLYPDIPTFIASSQQLGQVFLNLINNAIEAMTGGFQAESVESSKNEITVDTNFRNQTIIVNVADNGLGIPEQDLSHIFDPFYTRKKQTGVGIGLSICYGIIEDHHGTIEAKNSAQGGAVFTIKLPVSQQFLSKQKR